MKSVRHSRGTGAIALMVMVMTSPGWSHTFDVTARAEITRQQGHSHTAPDSSGDVVVWLVPTQKSLAVPAPRNGPEYMLVQKDKKFNPHILVVPTGSSVEFPNLDPFFHNVFSLFNGKRFDLGLYEAHSHRTVQFDREGISYIFCNIHPEMGAVVLALSTPYYGISKPDGSVVLHNVPEGSYRLNVWAENVANDSLNALSRVIEINSQNIQLGTIHLKTTDDVMRQHKNKFGENYPPAGKDPY
jgi:plastocyanin